MDPRDIENAKKEQLSCGASKLIMPDGSEWYSGEYVKEMMQREYDKGHREGIRIEKHIAVVELVSEPEKLKIVERIKNAVMDMRSMDIQPTDVFLCKRDTKELAEYPVPLPSSCVTTGGGGLKFVCSLINIDNSCLHVYYLESGERSIITVGDIKESKIIKVL